MYQFAIFGILVALMLERIWRVAIVRRFFAQVIKSSPKDMYLYSLCQPIVGGDENLARCLENTLATAYRQRVEILWLLDDGDKAAHRVCQQLITKYPERNVRILSFPPPPDNTSPKSWKVVQGAQAATGDIICSLDDDTLLPVGALSMISTILLDDSVGLVHALPYYTSFENIWVRLVSYYVNTISLPTLIASEAVFGENLMNPGMFWAMRRNTFEDANRLQGMDHYIADQDAVAKYVRDTGRRVSIAPFTHALKSEINDAGTYIRLMHRWLMYGRETLLPSLSVAQFLGFFILGFLPLAMPLLLFLLGGYEIATGRFPLALIAAGVTLVASWLVFYWLNRSYLRNVSPLRHSWLVFIQALLLPIQMLAAQVLPARMEWRGNIVQIHKGGGFHFVARKPIFQSPADDSTS